MTAQKDGILTIYQLGIMLAMLIAVPAQEKIYAAATRHGTYPEARLYTMMVGSMYAISFSTCSPR